MYARGMAEYDRGMAEHDRGMRPASRSWIIPLTLALPLACTDPEPTARNQAAAAWTTELHYRFGDAVEGDAVFHIIRSVRVGRDGERVLVVEPGMSRVSAWTPDGEFLFDVGQPGDGPGDLSAPTHVYLHDSGFQVRDRHRLSFFSDDGALRTTAGFPGTLSYQGFHISVEARFADGSFVGSPSIPAAIRVGMLGDDPIETLPLLLIKDSGDGWSHEPLVWRNLRNATAWLKLGSAGQAFGAQAFSDADRYRVDPSAGTVVIARSGGDDVQPGEAELLEVAAAGDTVWQRRLRFDPIPLAGSVLDEEIEGLAGLVESMSEGSPGALGRRSPRDVAAEALYAPEHLPAVRGMFLTSFSGHVWIRSHELVGTMRVWYSVRRGDGATPPRRVLLPESFRARDATETHVWGIWTDELGVDYVEGRRLVIQG